MEFMEFETDDHHVSGVGCSFCGRHIEPSEIDPIELTITARADRPRDDGFGIQTSWCHAACLESAGLSEIHVTRAAYWEGIDAPED
jgi:hypothetical protein